MRNLLVLTALSFTIGASPDLSQAPAAVAEKERLLQLDVVALDRQGNPVSDLRPTDVEVWLEGYRIPLESMTALSESDERRRRSIALVLDDMTITPEMVPRMRQAAMRLLERMDPGERISFGLLSGGGVAMTADVAAIRQRIDRFNARATAPFRAEDLAAQVFSTLTTLAQQVAEAPGHRKTLITIGPAWVFDTPVPPAGYSRDLQKEWTAALRALASANVAVYVLDPGGVGISRATSGSAGLARDTGGHAFTNTNDLAGAVDRIMREAASYYILRFEDPPFFRTAPLRKVEVRSTRRDVSIRARQLIPGTPGAIGK